MNIRLERAEQTRERIRQLVAKGVDVEAICARLNVTRQTIRTTIDPQALETKRRDNRERKRRNKVT